MEILYVKRILLSHHFSVAACLRVSEPRPITCTLKPEADERQRLNR